MDTNTIEIHSSLAVCPLCGSKSSKPYPRGLVPADHDSVDTDLPKIHCSVCSVRGGEGGGSEPLSAGHSTIDNYGGTGDNTARQTLETYISSDYSISQWDEMEDTRVQQAELQSSPNIYLSGPDELDELSIPASFCECARSYQDLSTWLVNGTRDPLFRQPLLGRPVGSPAIIAASEIRRVNKAKYRCIFCHHTFTAKHNLEGHIRAHLGEKPFKCNDNECGSAFTTKGDLNRHLRSRKHTGVPK